LGFYLAKKLNGEIVSLDASQVFKKIPIGSGVERSDIRQHLVEVLEPYEPIDSFKFIDLANSALEDIKSRGKTPIIVAGSTMYLTHLLHGIADLPSASKVFRNEWRFTPTAVLYSELKRLDPEIEISANDRPRIERALEVIKLTGKSIRQFQAEHSYRTRLSGVRMVCLWWNRQNLYKRIEERCSLMLKRGLLDEARSLLDDFGEDCPAMKSIGYKGFAEAIRGKKSLEEAREEFIRQTRQYAKRQMTYWKNEPIKRGWIVEPTSGSTRGDEVILRKGPKPKGVFVYEFDKDQLLEKILQTGENRLLNVAGESL
jgi:tRNA dimethylallyltransferase